MIPFPLPDRLPLVIGVVSDTHIPDRAACLHPALLPALSSNQVDLILHAGDLSTSSVLDELGLIAPVIACRGNRDLLLRSLPWVQRFSLAGIRIALLHGHGSWTQYLCDKVSHALSGYDFQRYQRLLTRHLLDEEVIIFGHTHRPVTQRANGRLYFNPGSASISVHHQPYPSFGIVQISAQKELSAKIISLTGAKLYRRRWVAD